MRLQQVGTEESLAALAPQLDAFFENTLKHHRIHISDNLFLSAIELPAAPGTPGTSLSDSSNTLVIIPGRAETEYKYTELLYNLKDSGLRVLVCFVRGQGQSSMVLYGSNKCHVERFLHYRQDVENILSYLDVGPNFKMMGFSLGGLISLEFCFNTRFKYKPQSLALMAPFLGINTPISPKVLYPILKVLCHIRSFAISYTPYGREYVRIPFEENFHSHSPERYNLYHDYYAANPSLALAGPTYKFVRCCLQAQLRLEKIKAKFDFPMLCISAGADSIVSTEAARAFCKRHEHDPVPPHFELIPHSYHDILNEADCYRNEALLKALNFLFPDSSDASASAAAEAAPDSVSEPVEAAAAATAEAARETESDTNKG